MPSLVSVVYGDGSSLIPTNARTCTSSPEVIPPVATVRSTGLVPPTTLIPSSPQLRPMRSSCAQERSVLSLFHSLTLHNPHLCPPLLLLCCLCLCRCCICPPIGSITSSLSMSTSNATLAQEGLQSSTNTSANAASERLTDRHIDRGD
jgi:hypothetical protein